MNLNLENTTYYRVKKGQTLVDIANAFHLPPRLLAAENGLCEEVRAGQILYIPPCEGNLYRITGRESKVLLSGSSERYHKKNKTDCFYPTQTVLI